MRVIPSRVSRRHAIRTLALIAIVIGACSRDQTTAPPTALRPTGPAAFTTITSLGSYNIPIPPTNTDGTRPKCCYSSNGGVGYTATGIVIPAGTFYRVRVVGSVTVSPNPAHQAAYPNNNDYNEVGTYGPGGTGTGNWDFLVVLRSVNTDGSGTADLNLPAQTGATAPDSARTDILWTDKETQIFVGRAGGGSVTNDNCCHWAIGMYALSSTQTVYVDKLTDVVHVTPSPVAVHANQQVTFTATRDDGGTLSVSAWHWDPDASGTAGSVCGWSNPCVMSVPASGAITVHASVGVATAHVRVYSSSFTVTSDKASVVEGDSVVFTSKLDGVIAPAARWKWTPTDTSNHADISCANGDSTCKRSVVTSGTMWAFTSMTAGQGDSATAGVTVKPRIRVVCTPADSIERGSSVSCAASASGTLALSGWNFTPIVSPLAADGSRPRTIDPTSVTWSGPVAASGVVTAQVTVGGLAAVSDTARIGVKSRPGWGWTGMRASLDADPGEFECFTEPHWTGGAWGWNVGPDCESGYAFTPVWAGRDTGGIVVSKIPAGPNEGIWYVTRISIQMTLHSQALQDIRADGVKYGFLTDAPTVSACAAAGLASPQNMRAINRDCQSNSTQFDSMYTRLWRHEHCHAIVSFAVQDGLVDSRVLGEAKVASDSIVAHDQVLFDVRGYEEASDSITKASLAIDKLPKSTYHLWFRDPQTALWSLVTSQAADGLAPGC